MNCMKSIKAFLLFAALSAGTDTYARDVVWQPLNSSAYRDRGAGLVLPAQYQVFAANSVLQSLLWSAGNQQAVIMELPMPDGSMRSFRVTEAPVMDVRLQNRYPDIKTFDAVAVDNSMVRGKLDFTAKGFHAMIIEPGKTVYIDPFSRNNDGKYIVYYRKDYSRPLNERMVCELDEDELSEQALHLTEDGLAPMELRVNGPVRRNYRLALSCTSEYATAVDGASPTKAGVLSAMVTSVNRVSGVYQSELAVTLTLIGNTDTLIFLPGDASSPFIGSNNNGSALLGLNQTLISNYIGSANYDIGHVFSTGGGGIAGLGVVCNNSQKARGVTGLPNPVGDAFDIDYVAHEMGHQFGGSHTFNAATGSCSGNGSQSSAYEPGSGSTIMAYAGICTGQDLQSHSDPFFHARSLEQIHTYITGNSVANCPTTTNTGNMAPDVPAFTAVYSIPSLTPFELIAPTATDNSNDTLWYSWEQWNRGGTDFGKTFQNTRTAGPIFRSFVPSVSPVRVFPRIDSLVRGRTNYFGEKLPDTTRSLRFKLTVRDVLNGNGAFNFPDDTIRLNVIHNGTPFSVTSPAAGDTWLGGFLQTITWNVSNTVTAPISCDSVDVFLSIDGGFTYPYLIGRTANDGSEAMLMPNLATSTTARIKVKGANNVFFNINGGNFTLKNVPASVAAVNSWTDFNVYPVPATNTLTIEVAAASPVQAVMINAVGQQVWSGEVTGKVVIPVRELAKGVYTIRLSDKQSGAFRVKQVVLQ